MVCEVKGRKEEEKRGEEDAWREGKQRPDKGKEGAGRESANWEGTGTVVLASESNPTHCLSVCRYPRYLTQLAGSSGVATAFSRTGNEHCQTGSRDNDTTLSVLHCAGFPLAMAGPGRLSGTRLGLASPCSASSRCYPPESGEGIWGNDPLAVECRLEKEKNKKKGKESRASGADGNEVMMAKYRDLDLIWSQETTSAIHVLPELLGEQTSRAVASRTGLKSARPMRLNRPPPRLRPISPSGPGYLAARCPLHSAQGIQYIRYYSASYHFHHLHLQRPCLRTEQNRTIHA